MAIKPYLWYSSFVRGNRSVGNDAVKVREILLDLRPKVYQGTAINTKIKAKNFAFFFFFYIIVREVYYESI